MVTHNGVQHIEEQVLSIKAQTLAPNRVFVVDDNSSDATRETTRRLLEDAGLENFFLAAPATHPFGAKHLYSRIAFNFELGIRRAVQEGFELIALADQDDRWRPDRIAVQRSDLNQPGKQFSFSNARTIDAQGNPLGQHLSDHFPVPVGWNSLATEEKVARILRQPMVTGATVMATAEFFRLAGPVPRGWLHDRWYSIVAVIGGADIYDPAPLIDYRLHDAQAVGARESSSTLMVRARRNARNLSDSVRKTTSLLRILNDRSLRAPGSDFSTPRILLKAARLTET